MRNKHLILFILFFSVIILAESCQNRPDYVLKRKDMERLMYDVYVAEAIIDQDYQTFNTPEKKEAFINEVFAKHNVNNAIWDSSLVWYSDRIDIYLKMNDSVKSRLQKEMEVVNDEMTKIYAKQQELQRRNSSPSYIPEYFSFDELYNSKGISFRLDSNEYNKSITTNDFDFSFEVIGIPSNNQPDIKAALILEYSDTILYSIRKIEENGQFNLHGSKYIPDDTLNRIIGFMHLYNDSLFIKPAVTIYNISLDKQNSVLDSLNQNINSEEKLLLKPNLRMIDSIN